MWQRNKQKPTKFWEWICCAHSKTITTHLLADYKVETLIDPCTKIDISWLVYRNTFKNLHSIFQKNTVHETLFNFSITSPNISRGNMEQTNFVVWNTIQVRETEQTRDGRNARHSFQEKRFDEKSNERNWFAFYKLKQFAWKVKFKA